MVSLSNHAQVVAHSLQVHIRIGQLEILEKDAIEVVIIVGYRLPPSRLGYAQASLAQLSAWRRFWPVCASRQSKYLRHSLTLRQAQGRSSRQRFMVSLSNHLRSCSYNNQKLQLPILFKICHYILFSIYSLSYVSFFFQFQLIRPGLTEKSLVREYAGRKLYRFIPL